MLASVEPLLGKVGDENPVADQSRATIMTDMDAKGVTAAYYLFLAIIAVKPLPSYDHRCKLIIVEEHPERA